ncbi:hypothetical protein [Nonomuraea dietziae]|uniref:Uncharacterized protein n=1 Tax=Nonomuraea dietziae TaxID=65515 RepID=A0A7W5Y8A0_9ACTN|nr:hypothetical protein [Nonomuraea dietziae]MBB3728253.1 hypothetical protein [Nonomuraea dietziae]
MKTPPQDRPTSTFLEGGGAGAATMSKYGDLPNGRRPSMGSVVVEGRYPLDGRHSLDG